MSFSTNTDDEAAALRELFRRVLYGVHTSTPGVVTAVGTFKGVKVVSVQPVIQQIDTLDDQATLKAIDPIPNVPLAIPYSQTLKLAMTIPVQVGDEGLIHFAERSLDNWLERGGIQPPAEPVQPRAHDLADAVFVPGIQPVPYAIANWSEDAIEIRNEDATTALSVSEDTVAMRSGGAVVSLPGDGKIYLTGEVIHTGDLTSSGKVTGVSGVETGAGISLDNHTHGGVQSGGSNTGPAQ